MLCPFCKEEIQDGAIKCKHCRSVLVSLKENSDINFSHFQSDNKTSSERSIGFAVASMLVGLLTFMVCIDNTGELNNDTLLGAFLMSLLGIGLGIGSIDYTKRGRGMAITGIILSILALLLLLSYFNIDKLLLIK